MSLKVFHVFLSTNPYYTCANLGLGSFNMYVTIISYCMSFEKDQSWFDASLSRNQFRKMFISIKGCNLPLAQVAKFLSFFFFFLIQFYVPFKIISAHMRRANQKVGENGRTPRKTTWHTRKQNLACLTCGQSGARTRTRHSGEMIE